jgi:glycosyltransferase involved in cell wall biosynthesis
LRCRLPRKGLASSLTARLNVLLFNLAMDARHPALGHVPTWTNELARRCEHVSVITMTAGRFQVDRNVEVYSLGKELGRSEPRRLVEFYRLVRRVLHERPIDVCFAHMAPLFSALFAPVARRRGIPVLLWYSHAQVTLRLRIAHLLADRCVTPTPAGFRLRSDKLFLVGHGVHTGAFRPPEQAERDYDTTALSVGRITPIKRIDEMLRCVAILSERGRDVRLLLVGGPVTPRDHEHEAALRRRCRSLGIEERVSFAGPIPFEAVPAWYRRGGLFLHLSPGALDKAILEAMASGCIPVSGNAAFRELAARHGLGRLVPDPGPDGLADCVERVLECTDGDRAELTRRLRGIVESEHSLSALADRLVGHLTELSASRR